MSVKVLVTGVFDLFHVGHLRYLQYARGKGDHLTVGVTPDALCFDRKGKWPIINECQRMEIIKGLGWVDRVEYIPGSLDFVDSAVAWIKEWDINHFVVGGDWQNTPRWQCLSPALARQGIDVSFAPHTHEISSSDIVREIQKRFDS